MIARYSIERATRMLAPEELKLVVISCRPASRSCPREYLLYGEEIKRYSAALSALRDVCDEISRRSRTGIVMPRIVVDIDDPDALACRCPDGEIDNLLDKICVCGPARGIELKTPVLLSDAS